LLNPGIEKLTILPGGKSLPNSAELLGSARMESLVFEMKNRYRDDRIIVFDSSSLLLSSDPLVFSRFVDGILLVVEAEKTSPNDLKRVMELLKDDVIIGTVMNKVKGEL
jgi:non-specific protein-tyrosine kinase